MIWDREARNNARALNALQDDYRRTFSTPEGQRVLTDLAMNWGGYGESPLADSHPEFRLAFYWMLERWGVNHVENRDDITAAICRIAPVRRESAPPSEQELDDLLGPELRPTPANRN